MQWEHEQFRVSIIAKYADQAYKTIQLKIKDLPGVIAVPNNKLKISYTHRFHFTLPREYPQKLGNIKIVNETPLFHPRITSVGSTACYSVNGEIDRVLLDIIYNVLLRPETVRPPSIFKNEDWGLDSVKMKWYINYGPQRIYQYLFEEWGKRQKKIASQTAPRKKIQILE